MDVSGQPCGRGGKSCCNSNVGLAAGDEVPYKGAAEVRAVGSGGDDALELLRSFCGPGEHNNEPPAELAVKFGPSSCDFF